MKVKTKLRLLELEHDYAISEIDIGNDTDIDVEIEGLKRRAEKEARDDVEIEVECSALDDDNTCLASDCIRFSVGKWEPVDSFDAEGVPVFGKTKLVWHDEVM